MELASYLSGEKWSDHPRCTHQLLASLARSVNDCTTDAGRSRLALLIPSVIGLTGEDVRIDAAVALRAARTALPVVAADRQRVMAVAVLTADRILAELEGRSPLDLDEASRRVLDDAPDAARWARHFSREISVSVNSFRRHSAPSTVRTAVLVGGGRLCRRPRPDPARHARGRDQSTSSGSSAGTARGSASGRTRGRRPAG